MKLRHFPLLKLALIVSVTSGVHPFIAETVAQYSHQESSGFYRPLTLAPVGLGSSPAGGGGGATAGTQPAESDPAALAKKSQNPIANMISVPIQNNLNFGVGPTDGVQYVGNVQPVVPTSLSKDWNLINRTIVPIIYQPRQSANQGSAWGLGDIQYQGYFTPAKPSSLIWGVGPVVNFPSATDNAIGSEKWSAGAGVVALTIQGPWVIGGLVNNIWSFAGSTQRRSVNQMTLQYFVNYNIPKSKGWYLTSAPTMSANWSAAGRNQWTVPLGGGVGKIFKLGKLPMNAQLQAFGYPAKPDGGPDWSLQFMIKFLFPK